MVEVVEQICAISSQSLESTHSIAAAAEQQLASMEEVSAASQSLSKMADELQEVVKVFKGIINIGSLHLIVIGAPDILVLVFVYVPKGNEYTDD